MTTQMDPRMSDTLRLLDVFTRYAKALHQDHSTQHLLSLDREFLGLAGSEVGDALFAALMEFSGPALLRLAAAIEEDRQEKPEIPMARLLHARRLKGRSPW